MSILIKFPINKSELLIIMSTPGIYKHSSAIFPYTYGSRTLNIIERWNDGPYAHNGPIRFL